MSQVPAPPPTLLLDALGTLVRLEDPAVPLRQVLDERFALQFSEAQVRAALTAEIAFYRAHLSRARDAASLLALRERCAEELRQALPPAPGLERIPVEGLTEALLDSLRFAPFLDAAPALQAARARGMALVVVSNWDISLHGVLADTGLAPLLDGIVTSAEVGAAKPDAEIFRLALSVTGGRAEEAVHVGDSLREDVEGARGAGITPILIDRSGAATSPAPGGLRVVATLGELVDP